MQPHSLAIKTSTEFMDYLSDLIEDDKDMVRQVDFEPDTGFIYVQILNGTRFIISVEVEPE